MLEARGAEVNKLGELLLSLNLNLVERQASSNDYNKCSNFSGRVLRENTEMKGDEGFPGEVISKLRPNIQTRISKASRLGCFPGRRNNNTWNYLQVRNSKYWQCGVQEGWDEEEQMKLQGTLKCQTPCKQNNSSSPSSKGSGEGEKAFCNMVHRTAFLGFFLTHSISSQDNTA